MSDQEGQIEVTLQVWQIKTLRQTIKISLQHSTTFYELFDFIIDSQMACDNGSTWTCHSQILEKYITDFSQMIGIDHNHDTLIINTLPLEIITQNLSTDVKNIQETQRLQNFDFKLIQENIQQIKKGLEESIDKYQKNIEEAIQFYNDSFKNIENIKQKLESQHCEQQLIEIYFAEEINKFELINRVNFTSIKNGLSNFENQTNQFKQQVDRMEYIKIPSYDCRIDLTNPQQIIYNGIDLCNRYVEDQNIQLIEFFCVRDSPLDLRIQMIDDNDFFSIRTQRTTKFEDFLKVLSEKYPVYFEEVNQDWTIFSQKKQIFLEDRNISLNDLDIQNDDVLIIDRKIINLNFEILDCENQIILFKQMFKKSLNIKQLEEKVLNLLNLDNNIFGLEFFYFGQSFASSESKEANILQNIMANNKTSIQGRIMNLTNDTQVIQK